MTTDPVDRLGGSAARPPRPALGALLLVAVAYFASAKVGLLIPYVGTHVSLVWLPTGVALAAFWRLGPRAAAPVYLAALAVNLLLPGPWWVAPGIALGNTLGPALAAGLLARWGFDSSFVHRRDLFRFLGAVGLGMLITASNGVGWLLAGGVLAFQQACPAWVTWWFGDAVGALLGGVPLVALRRNAWRDHFRGARGRVNLGLLLAVLAIGVLTFSPWISPRSAWLVPLLALPFCLSTLLALRGGVLPASLAVLLLSGAAACGTAQGMGPFAGHVGEGGLLALWGYMTAQACASLLVWGLVANLLTARRQLDALFSHADEGMLMVDGQGRLQAINPAAAGMLGIDAQAATGLALASLPHGNGPMLAARLMPAASAGPQDLQLQSARSGARAVELQVAHFHDAVGRRRCNLVLRDVTARRDAEARLMRSEHRLRTITDSVPALICHLDRGLHFTFVNATYRDWFGIDPAALLGCHVDEFVAPGHGDARRAHMERAMAQDERLSYELEVEANGRMRHLRSVYVPDHGPDGEVQGLYVLTMDITEMKAIEAKLNRLVRFDHLTGLLSRRSFEERIEEVARSLQRGGGGVALLFIDVDHFKAINDRWGHATGDEVLKEFAHRLQRAVRSNDTVARLAGDEFVVLLERVRGPEQAEAVASKVCAEMQPPFLLSTPGAGPLQLSASVGVAWCDGAHEISSGRILATADAALYEAKHSGRNAWRVRRCDETPHDA